MKKLITITSFLFIYAVAHAQHTYTQQMQAAVTRLDNANSLNDYQHLAGYFLQLATVQETKWLPYYYAAFCNAKIGWLQQDTDPDHIEAFTNKGEEEIKKAESLIDTARDKKSLSEIYCLRMMLNQARVFINPQTFGSKYGPVAFNYAQLAKLADPDNPRVLYLLGWQKFATPKTFGGDKALAKKLLTDSKKRLETQSPNAIEPHWGGKEVDDLLKQLK